MILLKPPPYVYHSWQRTVSSERKQAIGHQIPILPFPGTNSPCLSIPLGSREEATLYTIPFPPLFFACSYKTFFYCFLSLSTSSPSVYKIPISIVSLSNFLPFTTMLRATESPLLAASTYSTHIFYSTTTWPLFPLKFLCTKILLYDLLVTPDTTDLLLLWKLLSPLPSGFFLPLLTPL